MCIVKQTVFDNTNNFNALNFATSHCRPLVAALKIRLNEKIYRVVIYF